MPLQLEGSCLVLVGQRRGTAGATEGLGQAGKEVLLGGIYCNSNLKKGQGLRRFLSKHSACQ